MRLSTHQRKLADGGGAGFQRMPYLEGEAGYQQLWVRKVQEGIPGLHSKASYYIPDYMSSTIWRVETSYWNTLSFRFLDREYKCEMSLS